MRMTKLRESRTLAGRFRGGKLNPVMATAFKSGEGGMLTQTAMIELDPVVGRLITPVTAEMFAVYVPVQAMVALLNPTDPQAGITEVIRQRLLNGEVLFPLENEDEVAKRCGVMPVSIGGVKQVSTAVRLAHNCAVNFLRMRKYTYATQLAAANNAVTPALLSSTVLDRFNAVLNPDDHVNGFVPLDVSGTIPVKGIARNGGNTVGAVNANIQAQTTTVTVSDGAGNGLNFNIPGSTGLGVRVDMDAAEDVGFTLTDLYNAETMDRLTRQMRATIDANPIDGEEQVLRWAYGLEVDAGKNCFLLHASEVIFGQDLLKAMDGAGIEAEVTQSRLMQRISMTVPVPRTELGGVVVTFLTVKPDETLAEQPHPVLSQPWVQDNLMAEELQNDPMPVTAREVQAEVLAGDELTVCFYTGYNELRRLYVNYGYNRHVTPADIDVKNAMWQIEIPASVTPDNIVYPPDIDHYPFVDQDAEIARYMIASTLTAASPIYIGPSPVETVSVIDSEDLFEESV